MNLKPGENPSMPCTPFRISALALVLLLLSGCGGSSGGGPGSGSGGGGGSQPTIVTVTFTGPSPTAVATQIGSAPFGAVTPASAVTITLPSGTTSFGVAYVCPAITTVSDPTQNYQYVFEATTTDGTSFKESCLSSTSASQTGALTVVADASAIPLVSQMSVQAQSGNNIATASSGGPFFSGTLSAPTGSDTVDILAYCGSANDLLAGVKVLTEQTVPGAVNGGNTVVLAAADETTLQPITFSNPMNGGGTLNSTASYFLTGGGIPIPLGQGNSSEYAVVPATVAQTSGIYVIEMVDSESASSGTSVGTKSVITTVTSNTGGPVAVAFSDAWTFSAPTPAALPTIDTSYSGFAGKSPVIQSAGINWTSSASSVDNYSVTATQNYQNGSTSITLPNLSTIQGFLAAPSTGTTVSWSAAVVEGEIGNPTQGYVANASTEGVANSGTYAVP